MKMDEKQFHSRRGVAMVLAVAILGLVAACIVSLVAMISSEANRTEMQHQQSQLQQYHLAALAIAQSQLKDNNLTVAQVPFPEWAPNASIEWSKSNDSTVNCEITIGNHSWSHQFTKNGTRFVLSK